MKRIVKPPTATQGDVDKFWFKRFNVTQFLFDQQLKFFEDPADFKVAVCSRRAGKTIACAAHLVHTAINTPDVVCLYITLARTQAKKLVWKEIKKICDTAKLQVKIDETELSLEFQNKSIIYLSGAKDQSEIEKFRGLAIKLCYIDECQSFRAYIEDLIDDIIAPALMDYAGTLCLIGTPGPVPSGYFHNCAVTSEVWSKHHWTFWDNPHIAIKSGKTHQQILDRELKRRGVTMEDPSIQREWFGKWVLDSDSLLLHYTEQANDYAFMPEGKHYNYIMGIDVGHNDADAIAVLGWADDDPTTYLVEELITPKQDITALAEQVKTLQNKYNVVEMVMDMGALGKKIGEEIIRRHGIPVEAADKVRKMENIALLNDALRTGRFKAKKESKFTQESYLVEIDRDKSNPERIKVSDRFHSDIIDAVLYAFKKSPAYSYTPPEKKAQPGTREWFTEQEKGMFEQELQADTAAEDYQKWLNGADE